MRDLLVALAGLLVGLAAAPLARGAIPVRARKKRCLHLPQMRQDYAYGGSRCLVKRGGCGRNLPLPEMIVVRERDLLWEALCAIREADGIRDYPAYAAEMLADLARDC